MAGEESEQEENEERLKYEVLVDDTLESVPVLNCSLVVWNHVEIVTLVLTVKLRESDQLPYEPVPLVSLDRTRHQYVVALVSADGTL